MDIPYSQLSEQALQHIIIDFITHRDDNGDETPLEKKIEQVKKQLKKGVCAITFDPVNETCFVTKK